VLWRGGRGPNGEAAKRKSCWVQATDILEWSVILLIHCAVLVLMMLHQQGKSQKAALSAVGFELQIQLKALSMRALSLKENKCTLKYTWKIEICSSIPDRTMM
jgi:hypothetical protein